MSTAQDSGGVFPTVARNVFVHMVVSSIMVSNLRDMLVVVDTMFTVCMELSPTAPGTVGIGALVFCARSAIWITPSIQVRTWIVDTRIAHTQETTQTTHLAHIG